MPAINNIQAELNRFRAELDNIAGAPVEDFWAEIDNRPRNVVPNQEENYFGIAQRAARAPQPLRRNNNNRRMISNVTIGADPELFIYNTKTNKVVSSIGLIPGEKGNAWVKEGWEPGFGLEIDNILAEYNIPSVTTKEDWIRVHNFMKNEIRTFIQAKDPDLDIRHRGSFIVDDDQLNHPIAKLFG